KPKWTESLQQSADDLAMHAEALSLSRCFRAGRSAKDFDSVDLFVSRENLLAEKRHVRRRSRFRNANRNEPTGQNTFRIDNVVAAYVLQVRAVWLARRTEDGYVRFDVGRRLAGCYG